MTHNSCVCRSDRFVYSGKNETAIKQPQGTFFHSTSTKLNQHSGEAYCAVRNWSTHLSLCQNREQEPVAAPLPLPPLLNFLRVSLGKKHEDAAVST